MVLGDSLSAAYGIEQRQGWVNLLRERLETQYPGEYEVVNASISGDTSAGGLARLPQALEQHSPDILLLELGGNDGLRGLPPTQLESNLAQMIELGRDAGARVGLLGIRIPPNYGPAYSQAFEAVYPALAERFDIPLVTFILEGVALNDDLMQNDGIHPNAQGQPLILDNVWPLVEQLLQASSESRSGASDS
nr:arylesterase [Kushneria aurantia]